MTQPDTITNATCDARMKTLETKIGNIESDASEIKADLRVVRDSLPALASKVTEHDKFISGLKAWGLRVLITLSAIALTMLVTSGQADKLISIFKGTP